MLRSLAKDFWLVESPQRFYGVEIGTRMSVIKLSDGTLFIHSPIRLNPELKEQLIQLGEPAAIIAPNCMHHLYIGDYLASFPTSKIYAAPRLQEKRLDIKFHEVIEPGRVYPWSDEIGHLICGGMPKLNEAVFLHRASKTLLLTDLVFNLDAESSTSARVFARLNRIYRKLGVSWVDRLLFLRDEASAAASFDAMLAWDFDRIILAHGKIVEQDAKRKLREALTMWFSSKLKS